MFGFNSATIFGELLDDPIPVKSGSSRGCAFRLNASYGKQKLVIWCFSISDQYQVTSTYNLRAGQCVLFLGALVATSTELRRQVGEPTWGLSLHGRVYGQLESARLIGSPKSYSLCQCFMTGMVRPGIVTWDTFNCGDQIRFKMLCEGEMFWNSKILRRSQFVEFHSLDIADVKELVVPGAVLFVRGYLFQSGTGNYYWINCLQVESMGVVQEKLLERYSEHPLPEYWEKSKWNKKVGTAEKSSIPHERHPKYPWKE